MATKNEKIGTTAMLLAAGLGTRMRPLSDKLPKPLVQVSGKPLIDHALERVRRDGIKKVVVNVHYKADLLDAHLSKVEEPEIVISDERKELLETGGGLRKALPLLGKSPFLVINTDSIWTESTKPALERLRDRWDSTQMDILMLLSATTSSIGYSGAGDFHINSDGSISRRAEFDVTPFVFTGVYAVHPRIFKGAPKGKFSMNLLYDEVIAKGRLKGLRHDGLWMEITTPEAIKTAEQVLKYL